MADVEDIDRPEEPRKPLDLDAMARMTRAIIGEVDLVAAAHGASITETLQALDLARVRLETIRDK